MIIVNILIALSALMCCFTGFYSTKSAIKDKEENPWFRLVELIFGFGMCFLGLLFTATFR